MCYTKLEHSLMPRWIHHTQTGRKKPRFRLGVELALVLPLRTFSRKLKRTSVCVISTARDDAFLKNEIYDPAILSLGTYQKEVKAGLRALYTHVHSSFSHSGQKMEVAQVSINAWIDKIWSIYLIGYHLALKVKEILIPVITWMNLRGQL